MRAAASNDIDRSERMRSDRSVRKGRKIEISASPGLQELS